MNKGFIHIPVILVLVIVIAFGTVLLVNQPNPNTKGVMIAHQGENDDSNGSSGSGSSGSGSSGSSDSSDKDDLSKSSGSGSSGSTETKTVTSEGTKIETKTTPEKQKTEIKFSEDEKIKTEIKEGRTRIDVYSGGVKVRYEIRDGRVIIKAETEEGKGVSEQELFKIVDRVDKSGIKIATAGGKLLISRNNIGATSNFPLQVDLNTNQLIVTTPAGTKVVTVLPDQAVQNMLAANVISRLGAPALKEATSTAQVIQLGLKNNIPVYEIPGIKQFNLLGFIPVDRPITALVSADTGELINTEQSLLTRIIDLLSP